MDTATKKILAPQAGSQTEFLSSPYTEVLMAGEAGGGKSFALTLAALRYYREKNYHAVIFRRNYPDLEDLIHKTIEIYKPLGFRFNEQKHLFIHEEFGSRIKFSHLANIKDIYDHQGQEYDFIGFDELCQFPKLMYTYLFSRLRGPNPKVRRFIRSTANPDGEGILWVKARFVECLDPNVPKWFLSNDSKDIEVARGTPGSISRCFIPSIRSENKVLMENDPQYEAMLNQLPEDKKRALKFGIWDQFDKPFQLIKSASFQKMMSGDVKKERGLATIGADYAESGDRCAMCVGVGNAVVKFKEWPGMDTDIFAREIIKEAERLATIHGADNVRIGVDSIGPGAGVYHALRKHPIWGSKTDPMRYKDPAFKDGPYVVREKFNNLRSQMWWKASKDTAKGLVDASALQAEKTYYDNMGMLQEELMAHTYEERNGLIVVIDKATLRKPEHLGRSPDRADAFVIWNFIRDKRSLPKQVLPESVRFSPEFNEHRQRLRERTWNDRGSLPDADGLSYWQAG